MIPPGRSNESAKRVTLLASCPTYSRSLSTPPSFFPRVQSVCQNHHNVAEQTGQHTHGQPLEEELPRPREIEGVGGRRFLEVVILLGQGFAWMQRKWLSDLTGASSSFITKLTSRPEEGLLWYIISVGSRSGDAADGECCEVDDQESYRVADLQHREEGCYRIRARLHDLGRTWSLCNDRVRRKDEAGEIRRVGCWWWTCQDWGWRKENREGMRVTPDSLLDCPRNGRVVVVVN